MKMMILCEPKKRRKIERVIKWRIATDIRLMWRRTCHLCKCRSALRVKEQQLDEVRYVSSRVIISRNLNKYSIRRTTF